MNTNAQRHRQGDRGAHAGRTGRTGRAGHSCAGADIQPAAHGAGALRQANQPEGLGLGAGVSGDAAAVVGDFQRQHATGIRHLHLHLAAGGMFGDVGEGFLGCPVGHQLNLAVKGHSSCHGGRRVNQPCLDAAAFFKTRAQPFERRQQALVQDGRAQIHHDGLAGGHGLMQHAAGLAGVLLGGGIGAVAGDPAQVKSNRRQGAANVVVDFAGDAGALLLNRRLQVFGKSGQAFFGGGQFGVGPHFGHLRLVRRDGALDHRAEFGHVVLGEVVADAQLDRFDRRPFADGARQQDERRPVGEALQGGPGVQCGETGQVVVGQNRRKTGAAGSRAQQPVEFGEAVHPRQHTAQTGFAQCTFGQLVVQQRIFQMQNVQGGLGRLCRLGGLGRGVGHAALDYPVPSTSTRQS